MSSMGGAVVSSSFACESIVKKMLAASTHRGSDCEAYTIMQNIGFMHRQLWTTPESKSEQQPLVSKDDQLMLTADARLDNRTMLLNELFPSESTAVPITDADLLLNAYSKWGEKCVEHLIGDFAFAILDKKNQKLFCARDHLGIKPFYYLLDEKGFFFASEVGALFSASGASKELDEKQVRYFFNSRSIDCEATFFKRIKRLLPGHILVYQDEDVDIQRYWFPEKIAIDHKITFSKATQKLRLLLEKAVKDRLRSAYGIGCELSGGVDSTSILALALQNNRGNITAFSSRYGSLACDEGEYIEAASDHFGVNPIEIQADQLDYAEKYSLKDYYRLAPDWPGRGSFLDAKAEMEAAKKRGIRVILTGQGGDHVATGASARLTDYFLSADLPNLWREHRAKPFRWKSVRNHLLVPLLPENVKKILRYLLRREQRDERFSPLTSCLSNIKQCASLSQKFEIEVLCGASNHLWMDSNPYNAIGGLYDIEFRHPFFDKRVVEFMLSLPPGMKAVGDNYKIILREAMKDLLPNRVYTRKDKAEFTESIEVQLAMMKEIEQDEANDDNFMGFLCYDNTNKRWNHQVFSYWYSANFKRGEH